MWQPTTQLSNLSETRGSRQTTDTTGTAEGQTITAAASTHTKGTYADLTGGVTSFPYEAITLCIADVAVGDTNTIAYGLLDLAIDSTTPGTRLITDLAFATNQNNAANEAGFSYYIPIHVPAGVTLSARIQTHVASGDLELIVIGHKTALGGAPGFSRLEALGSYTAASRGTTVDTTNGANVLGNWVELVASTAVEAAGMYVVLGGGGDTARGAVNDWLVDIGVGASGFESVLYSFYVSCSTARDAPGPMNKVFFACHIPAGTRIVARTRCNVATAGDRAIDLAVYAFVA